MMHALRGAEIGAASGPGELDGRHSKSGKADLALQGCWRANKHCWHSCERPRMKADHVLGIVRSVRLEAKPSDNCSERCFR
jgi:hypothetical protein